MTKSFEEKLASLEEIISDLNSDEISLAHTVSKYKEGSKLIDQCRQELNSLEKQVNVFKQKQQADSAKSSKQNSKLLSQNKP